MNDLDICKRIAEIDGAKETLIARDNSVTAVFDNGVEFDYNPLTDKALNCELRDKHEVGVDYIQKVVWMYVDLEFIAIEFKSAEEIPRAICLAIIEAKAND